jgi:molecular chaperone IbpA
MNQLVRFDTNTLNRALIGFDTLFDDIEKRFANQIQTTYPPHNVVKFDDDNYEIQLAVSGFDKDEVTVEVADRQLTIKGEHVDVQAEGTVYLHRGLGMRNFTRVFPLAEHIEVGKAIIKNGILHIALQRVLPEALKPRVIDITEVK